jgi:hypothetical protein
VSETMNQFLVRAYLNGDMDEQTESMFELELLRNPQLTDLAQDDLMLSMGLQAASAQTSSMPRRATRVSYLPLALAASVGAGLAGGLGLWLTSAQVEGAATLAYVDKVRSLSETPELRIRPNAAVVLMVPVASAVACDADIAVRQGTNTYTVTSAPDEYGYAAAVLPKDLLREGQAAIDVFCKGDTVGQYTVRITR